MEKNKQVRTAMMIGVFALILSIGGVVYAALSTTLTINGGGTFDPANWDVKFNGTVNKVETGGATGTVPTLTATNVGTYAVTLTAPGDSVTYTFDVTNTGDIDAILGVFNKPAPVCTGTGTNAATDASLVCDNLVYTLNYTTGGTAVAQSDTLNAGDTKNLTLTVEYPSTQTSVPTDTVTIDFPVVTLTYEQN